MVQEAEGRAREVVDMALLHGWLQVADYAALLGLMTQPNAVPLSDGREALATEGLYVELVRARTNITVFYKTESSKQKAEGHERNKRA